MIYEVNKCTEYAMKDSEGEKLDVKAINSAIEDAKENPVIPTTLSTNILTSSQDQITATKPVVEDMTGYTVNVPTVENVELENIYTGIVKNGNKLTIVHFTKITKRAGAASEHSILGISIPSSIGNKLFPYLIGSYSILDNRNLTVFSNINASISIPAYIAKVSDNLIYIGIRNSLLVEDTTYFLRYEATFLLSNNLITVTP